MRKLLFAISLLSITFNTFAQQPSIARLWMDEHLIAIKWDGQGPTIHSRNMFHLSLAMYESWAFYQPYAKPYFLGQKIGDYQCDFDRGFEVPTVNLDSASQVAISYAAYQFMRARFSRYSSKTRVVIERIEALMDSLQLDKDFSATDYTTGSPAALGNYIAQQIIEYGLQDGAHEEDNYESYSYHPGNPPLRPDHFGNPSIVDVNRWQPIAIRPYVKEKGHDKRLPEWHELLVSSPDDFLTPEWGDLQPFALRDYTSFEKSGYDYKVYLDPGMPPRLDYEKDSLMSEHYKWGFLLNILWSGQMDTSDGVMWDISPGARGGFSDLPKGLDDYAKFYDLENGGSFTKGRKKNPYTGKPYKENIVPRGDYARVIAEYWVDGVFTYSPPGHWVDVLNKVARHPDFKRKWKGNGPELSQLEWDIRAYLTLTGALMDAGIAAWSAKGYHDYIRPISAIRAMAGYGQCSDPQSDNYDKRGLPLIPGAIEMVKEGDVLAGENREHVGKLKLYTWKGPDYINNPATDVAGVGWILAGNWWPYQRYSFATPPFAGYVSGHSTFSTCAAEVLTKITGDEFFPGGLFEFTAKKDSFLEFEKGPSMDVTLQWATYHDAANETSLSRLWGGIHPPADDIPGRYMGIEAAKAALKKVDGLIKGNRVSHN